MISHTDADLEAKIGEEYNAMMAAKSYADQMAHCARMSELVKRRSPRRVVEMERPIFSLSHYTCSVCGKPYPGPNGLRPCGCPL